jgi:Flp pilus assembly CpaF family ATPase
VVPAHSAPLNDEAGLAREDRERLTSEILDDILGYGPLERLLADDSITEVMQRSRRRLIERGGKLYETTVRFTDESHLRRIINKIARRSAAASTSRRRWSTPACPTARASTRSSRPCRSSVP